MTTTPTDDFEKLVAEHPVIPVGRFPTEKVWLAVLVNAPTIEERLERLEQQMALFIDQSKPTRKRKRIKLQSQ